jgi:peptidoglycan hydrolase-like protein with peptidoglycan-binding domain
LVGLAGPAQASPLCSRQDYGNTFFYDGHTYKAWNPLHSGSYAPLDCEMGPGVAHAGVKALQRSLRYCHDSSVVIDGIYGPKTRDAVKKAQSWYNARYGPDIAVDGIYGPNTRDAMLWYGYSSTAGKYRCSRMMHFGGS